MSHNEEPCQRPYCCKQRAKWVVLSPRLAYFYCEVCKNEVPQIEELSAEDHEQYSLWGMTLPNGVSKDLPVKAPVTYEDLKKCVQGLTGDDGVARHPDSKPPAPAVAPRKARIWSGVEGVDAAEAIRGLQEYFGIKPS